MQGGTGGAPPCASSVSPPLLAVRSPPCSLLPCVLPVPVPQRAACSGGIETSRWKWSPGPCRSLGCAKLRFGFLPPSGETGGMDGTSGPGWPPPSLG